MPQSNIQLTPAQQKTLKAIAKHEHNADIPYVRIVGSAEKETRADFLFAHASTVRKLVELGYLEQNPRARNYLSVGMSRQGTKWIWTNAPEIYQPVSGAYEAIGTKSTITVLEALEMTLPSFHALHPRYQGDAVRSVTTLGNGRYFIHLVNGTNLDLVPGSAQIVVDQPQPAPSAAADPRANSISAVRQYKRIVVPMEWHEIEFLMSVHPTHLDLSEPPNVLILSSEEFGDIISALAQSPNTKMADAVLNRIGKALGELSAGYTSTSGVKVESMDEYMQREYNRTLTPIETELDYNRPQPYRVITRADYKWLWREARMAQLDKCFDYYYFPIPEGAELHTATWYQMIEYYFDNPDFYGWVNLDRRREWQAKIWHRNSRTNRGFANACLLADTIDAYIEAVDPTELDELIQLQADKEQIALEIQEAEGMLSEERRSQFEATAKRLIRNSVKRSHALDGETESHIFALQMGLVRKIGLKATQAKSAEIARDVSGWETTEYVELSPAELAVYFRRLDMYDRHVAAVLAN